MYSSLWYNSLLRPPFSPPNWLFAPVWIVLYLLMFISLIIYFLKPQQDKKSGYIYFFIQLLLNILWSPVFFMLQNIGGALVVVILLVIFVFLTIKRFYLVSKLSAYMLLPYFVWIIFATYLTAGYFLINRSL